MSNLWQKTRDELRRQLGDAAFDKYFGALTVLRDHDGVLELGCHDQMTALVVERSFLVFAQACASEIQGELVTVKITHIDGAVPEAAKEVAPPAPSAQLSLFAAPPREVRCALRPPEAALQVTQVPAQAAPTAGFQVSVSSRDRINECGLSARLDLESFVVGPSNEFAFEAASAVIENPGTLYSPLLMYGGVGLGKTHLMNAIGLDLLRRDPRLRVRYLSAETFVNELIQAIKNKQMERFRQQNRIDVDVLLVDDVQFIAGKERTQEEFFHTFNALQQGGCQIVLTSDRIPQEMPGLKDRLVSRLSMGLITDIQPPDFETRIAILERKAEALRFDIPREVIVDLAQSIRSNVRELHGALMRVGSYARHHRTPITLEIARSQLAKVLNEQRNSSNPTAILKATCAHYGVRTSDIKGRRRTARIAEPRKVAMYLSKKWTTSSYPELGRFFGRDHTTVLHANQSVEKAIAAGNEIRTHIEAIERDLRLV